MNNIRNIAIVVAALGAATFANAQSFELRAGAGSTLNGNTFVVSPSGSFSVEVWFTPASAFDLNGMFLGIGFGKASNSTDTSDDDGKLVWGGGSTNLSGLPNLTFGAPRSLRNPTAGGNNPFGAATGSAAARPWGVYASALISPPNVLALSGEAVKVATLTFSHTLANGETYGDDEQGGLLLYTADAPSTSAPGLNSTGFTGFASGTTTAANGRAGSIKYAVQAVPEPGTMAAIAAGIAALASRRRKKS